MTNGPIERIAYKISEVSEMTGIPESTLYGLVREKKLAASRYGKRSFVVRREALDEFLKTIEVQR